MRGGIAYEHVTNRTRHGIVDAGCPQRQGLCCTGHTVYLSVEVSARGSVIPGSICDGFDLWQWRKRRLAG